MKLRQFSMAAALAAAAAMTTALPAGAQNKGLENPRSTTFHTALEGKKVAFLPLSMGFDLTEGWAARMRAQASSGVVQGDAGFITGGFDAEDQHGQ